MTLQQAGMCLALAVAVVCAASAQSSVQTDKPYQAALQKEMVTGDLKGAIEDYRRISVRPGVDRALAATALMRMAECYQKLGDTQARQIFAQVVRDFGDQKEIAARAQTRLSPGVASTPVKGDRSVWAGRGADGFGTISPDGRWLTFTDWANGAALMRRDLVTGAEDRLTSGGATQFSAISKDGRQVAYEWSPNAPANESHYELRVARLTATGLADSRTLFHNPEVTGMLPYDWSADGNWIAVSVRYRDGGGQIGVINTRDGVLRKLKSTDWMEPVKIFFSPDGRYIGYDLMVTDDRTERHVFVMAVDASLGSTVVAHASQNTIMGWSPDGGSVLFSSDRSGAVGLWAVNVKEGKATGDPTLLKPDIASSWSLGLTAAGTMYVWKLASPVYVQSSPIDLAGGKLSAGPASFQRFVTSRGRPAWSADGKHLAYQSCDSLGAGPCTLWIRSMETGQLRELKVKLGYFAFMFWSPDGRELLTRGRDVRGRNPGLYRIDVHTGDATLLADSSQADAVQWAPDGKHVYIARGSSIIERDFASGTEREIAQIPTPGTRAVAFSPDGRSVALEASGTQTLYAMTIGGPVRELTRFTASDRLIGRTHWTSDGRMLAVATRRDDDDPGALWIVDASSGQRLKLEVDTSNWKIGDGFSFDRSGTQLAFVASAGQPGLEIRALENFLPNAATRR